LLCAEPITFAGVMPCNHGPLCWLCLCRMRELMHDPHCPICKQDHERAVVTKVKADGTIPRFEDLEVCSRNNLLVVLSA